MTTNTNSTTKTLADLKVGDTAVVEYRSRHSGTTLTPVTVTKITPSGRIKTMVANATAEETWCPNGSKVGNKYGSWHLRPFNPGETAETIKADRAAAYEASLTKAAAERAEYLAKVDRWWAETGEAMWCNAVEVPGDFLGKKVYILRFTRHSEQFMPFVTFGERSDFRGGKFMTASAGGLVGRQYERSNGESETNISNYSSSEVEGESLHEVLYKIATH